MYRCEINRSRNKRSPSIDMPSWSSDETYKRWQYAVKTDFHGLDDQATELKTINLTYDSCDRFLPFDRSPGSDGIVHATSDDATWLAIGVGSDVDVYDLKTGKKGVFVGHGSHVNEVAFVPGHPTKLVSWSEADYESLGPSVPRNEIIVWDIKDDITRDEILRERNLRVEKASQKSVEQLQALLNEQDIGIELQETERNEVFDLLKKTLDQIARQRSLGKGVKIDGTLASSAQAPPFNHAGDTLIYLPGSQSRSNGDSRRDIMLYNIQSGITQILTGHRDAIRWIGFSPDDSLVASASFDETFRVWDAHTGEQKHKWVTDMQNCTGAFRPDGTQFLGTDGTGAIRIWDVKTGEVVAKHEQGNYWKGLVEWTPDGRYIAVGEDGAGRISLFDTRLPINESGDMVPIQQRVLDATAVSDDEAIQGLVTSCLSMRRVTWGGAGLRLFSSTNGEVAVEIVDFNMNVKWRILPFEPTGDAEADWERLPKSGTYRQPVHPGYSYFASSGEIALVCHDGVRFWKL